MHSTYFDVTYRRNLSTPCWQASFLYAPLSNFLYRKRPLYAIIYFYSKCWANDYYHHLMLNTIVWTLIELVGECSHLKFQSLLDRLFNQDSFRDCYNSTLWFMRFKIDISNLWNCPLSITLVFMWKISYNWIFLTE